MSTSCRVGVETEQGVRSVYVHSDGPPRFVGRVLVDHYAEPQRAMELIGMGDASRLRPLLEACGCEDTINAFPSRCEHRDHSRFYGRDRGDAGVAARVDESREAFVARESDSSAQWLYLLTPEGWLGKQSGYRDLERDLAERWRPLAAMVSEDLEAVPA